MNFSISSETNWSFMDNAVFPVLFYPIIIAVHLAASDKSDVYDSAVECLNFRDPLCDKVSLKGEASLR